MKNPVRLLLCVLFVALWVKTLDIRDIANPDEGRYSEISREMALSGDWVTPRLNGLKYFEKPPLQYWATAAAFKVFGVHELSARLWGGLCGLLTVLMLWFTARRLWNHEIADNAAMASGSMLFLTLLSHTVTLDMGVSFFLALALCGFLLAHHDGARVGENRWYMRLTWAAMAGAVLSKGLIGIVIPGAVLVLYTLLCRQWAVWGRMQWVAGLLIFFAVAAPWHVLVAQRNPEWAQFYFIHEHFDRFLTTEHRREEKWYFFVPLLLVGLIPWLSWFPALLKRGIAAQPGTFQVNRFLLIWSGFIFVFFSLSGSKLPSYILPVFPALLLLLAPALAQTGGGALKKHAAGLVALWMILAAAALLLGLRGDGRTPEEFLRPMMAWALGGTLTSALLATAAVWFAQQQGQRRAILMIACSGLSFMVFSTYAYQAYSPLRSSRDLTQWLRPKLQPDSKVFSVGSYDQTLPYYLGRTVTLVAYVDEFELGQQQEPEKYIATLEIFAKRWKNERHAIAVMRPDFYEQSVKPLNLDMKVIERAPRRIVLEKPAIKSLEKPPEES